MQHAFGKHKMKHTAKTFGTLENILLQHASKTIATYATCATSHDLLLQHPMKQMQHTSETLETTETYNCNTGGEREPGTGSGMAVTPQPSISS